MNLAICEGATIYTYVKLFCPNSNVGRGDRERDQVFSSVRARLPFEDMVLPE
jgi:hypothetical protein